MEDIFILPSISNINPSTMLSGVGLGVGLAVVFFGGFLDILGDQSLGLGDVTIPNIGLGSLGQSFPVSFNLG